MSHEIPDFKLTKFVDNQLARPEPSLLSVNIHRTLPSGLWSNYRLGWVLKTISSNHRWKFKIQLLLNTKLFN